MNASLSLLVSKILQAARNGDPSVSLLLSACPELSKSDWINRCGRAEWGSVASSLGTDQLEWLIKAVVVAERHFEWSGGSVAAAIWLFQIYARQNDADQARLANWVLRNRGRNLYLPFGSMTSARTLDEWHAEQKERRERYNAHIVSQENDQITKAKNIFAKRQSHLARVRGAGQRRDRLTAVLGELYEVPVVERLAYIADNHELPLEFIPKQFIQDCLSVNYAVDSELREKLLKRIGSRNKGVWKTLRAILK